jgi:PAS domain S-box-containing protein
MNPTNETSLRPDDVDMGRLFWLMRDAVVVGEAESGRILLWSPAAEQMFGYSAAEAVGQPIELLVPAHLQQAHRDGLRHYQQTGRGHLIDRGVPLELPAVHKSGEMRWIELSLNPVEAAHRPGRLVLAIIRDATARREAHDAHRECARAEALAADRSAILDQIAEGVIITDPRGRITFVNAAAQRIHGTGRSGAGVESYAAAYRPRTLDGQAYPEADLPLTRAVRHGESVLDARWRIERPDGAEIIAEGSATPVLGADGTRLGSVLVMRDVTGQVALEREKEDFLTSVSHDLKNPLTAVQGTAQLLRSEAAEPNGIPTKRLEARLASIESASKRMRAMLDQLLDMARLGLDRELDLNVRSTELTEVVRRVMDEQQATSQRHRLTLESSVVNLIGQWDTIRLERVIGNLLGNAVKYSPAGGEIVVRLSRQADSAGAWAVIDVVDHGLGIPAQDLPCVFERFRRGTNVIGQIPGTGIGLQDVRQTLESMNGTVDVYSREGLGSTFSLRLPLARAA